MNFRDTVKQTVLPNGLVIITDTLTDNPVTFGGIVMLTGGLYDPSDKLGISHLGEHMIAHGLEGETSKNFREKNNERGLKNYNMVTAEEYVSFYAYGENSDVIDYLTDMSLRLTERRYDQEALILEKSRITTEMREYYEREDNIKRSLSKKSRLGQSKLMQPTSGYAGGFEGITLQDIAGHHDELLVGQNMALISSGGWSHEAAVNWAYEHLAHFPEGVKPKKLDRNTQIQDVFAVKANRPDVDVEISFPTGLNFFGNPTKLHLLTSILQDLVTSLADEIGVYGIQLTSYLDSSQTFFLGIETSCLPGQVPDLLKSVLSELDRVSEDYLREKFESIKAKAIKGKRLHDGVEMLIPEDRFDILIFSLSIGDLDQYPRYEEDLNRITTEELINDLKYILAQKPGTFYYGAVNDSLPTGDMIMRREFHTPGKRPQIISKFSPV